MALIPRVKLTADRWVASLPGVDVTTADLDDRSLISFNSDWDAVALPLFAVGKVQSGRRVTHSLGYRPVFDVAVIETDTIIATKEWNAGGGTFNTWSNYGFVTDNYLVCMAALNPQLAADYPGGGGKITFEVLRNDPDPAYQMHRDIAAAWHVYKIYERPIP